MSEKICAVNGFATGADCVIPEPGVAPGVFAPFFFGGFFLGGIPQIRDWILTVQDKDR
jgi:hypothetical protein